MKRYQYRSIEQAQAAGRQTGLRILHGLGGSKHFPDFTASLKEYIANAQASRARVAHDPLLAAYWDAQIAVVAQHLNELNG